MNATLLSVMLATVFAPPATTSAERSTRIYVRTTPPGASIVLDGKELGTSDGLFLVPPGVRKITLEMDGYDPHGETLDVKEGWITRVEVRMVRKEEKPPEGAAATVASQKLYFVRWVIQDEETMTFEGAPVEPDELPSLLEKVPNRAQTVLEVGYSSEISVKLRNECVGRAIGFAKQFGFKYASDIGEQKLGSKGSLPQAASDQPAGAANPVLGLEPPEAAVVREFLEAMRAGDNAKAASLFTRAARAKIKELGYLVAPVKSRTATFAVGDVTRLKDGQSRVTASWTDDGRTTQMTWILRSGEEGWRIVGMETRVRDGMPPLLLDFENVEEAMKNVRALAEAARAQQEVKSGSADRLSQVERELSRDKIELEKELLHYGDQHPRIRELRARIKAGEEYLASHKNGAEASARSQADSSLKATVYPLRGPGVRWHIGADGSMTFCNIPTTFEEVEGLAARVADPRQVILLLEFEIGVEQAVRERAEKLAAELNRKFEFKGTFSCPPPGQPRSARTSPDETDLRRHIDAHIAGLTLEVESARTDGGISDDGRSRPQRTFERIIYDLDERIGLQTIDLETGWSYDLPEGIWAWEPQRVRTWIEEHEVDLIADHEDNQWGLGLTDQGGILVPAPDVSLDEAANRVSAVLEEKERLRGVAIRHEEPVIFWLLPEDSKPPLSFAFRTAEGTEGLLQIIEINSLSHRTPKPEGSPPIPQPKSMRLRWKVTKRADETPTEVSTAGTTLRRVHLPGANAKDSPFILDLASGQMLSLPWVGSKEDPTHFTKLGKGDLGFDSMLVCLRGGEIELLGNGAAESCKVDGWKDDAKVYPLPKNLPCELVVTTPEKRRFLVKVLAETAKGGLDIEYRQLGEKEEALPVSETSQPAAAELAAGVLEFRIAANDEEAKAFERTGTDLGWYESATVDAGNLVTRKQGKRVEVLLWQTSKKSMTAGESDEKAWRIIEVSVIAEPNKPGRIGVVFDEEGGRRLQALTAGNIDRGLAMLVDGRVVACPTVRSPISQRVEITGDFSKEELARLADALQAGMKPERPSQP